MQRTLDDVAALRRYLDGTGHSDSFPRIQPRALEHHNDAHVRQQRLRPSATRGRPCLLPRLLVFFTVAATPFVIAATPFVIVATPAAAATATTSSIDAAVATVAVAAQPPQPKIAIFSLQTAATSSTAPGASSVAPESTGWVSPTHSTRKLFAEGRVPVKCRLRDVRRGMRSAHAPIWHALPSAQRAAVHGQCRVGRAWCFAV